MIVNILGRDINMSKVSQVSDWDGQEHYRVTGTGIDREFYEQDYPRKKFVQTWKNSQVVAKPVLVILIPFKNLKQELAGQQIKGLVDWVTGQANGEYHVICFAEKVEKLEVNMLSLADVDDTTIDDLQEKILVKIDELTKETEDESQNDQEGQK